MYVLRQSVSMVLSANYTECAKTCLAQSATACRYWSWRCGVCRMGFILVKKRTWDDSVSGWRCNCTSQANPWKSELFARSVTVVDLSAAPAYSRSFAQYP